MVINLHWNVMQLYLIRDIIVILCPFNHNSIGEGGGQNTTCDSKCCKKCPHNNNIALKKTDFPLQYCFSHDKYIKFQLKIIKKTIDKYGGKNWDMVNFAHSPNTTKECFTPILLELPGSVNLIWSLDYFKICIF